MKVTLVFLIFAFVAATTARRCYPIDEACKAPHQEYSRCNAKPSCQKTCDNYKEDGIACTKECFEGCVCEAGYVRDAEENCIAEAECPEVQPICRADEHKLYSQCNAHCPIKTCENPEGPVFCTRNCVPGCICEEGYLQDSEGNCITQDSCPAIQPICSAAEHKLYSECDAYPRNQKTCENPEGPFAIADICAPGCICEEGYLQDGSGNCVTKEECSPIQPICSAAEHKLYTECGAACKSTCENPNPQICPAVCAEGCVCEEGYLEDSEGNCITQDACPAIQPICSAAEHKLYSQCGAFPSCQKTCENYRGPIRCPRICAEGCVCEEGYVMDSAGKCVTEAECPEVQPICSAAEHKLYTECGAMCKSTCDNPNPMICPAICASGCICEEGYLEDSAGNCITQDACPAIQPICSAAEHKLYSECDAYPRNQKTCENPEGPFAIADICAPGCVCEEGYLQDGSENCVTKEACPSQPIQTVVEDV